MPRIRTSLLITAAVATAVTLSACTGAVPGIDTEQSNASSSAPSASASGSFNDADTTFAQMMIPHHEQAVAMSDVVIAKNGLDQRVLDLAAQIKSTQEPEIKQLTAWLTAWGADGSGMAGMSHGADGMMSQGDKDALDAATGPEASKLFLSQMMVHHQGAIDMAQTEIDNGQNADAKKMATAIVSTQTVEIAVMKELLGSL